MSRAGAVLTVGAGVGVFTISFAVTGLLAAGWAELATRRQGSP